MEWQTQRLCSAAGEYELIVEMQKHDWECEDDPNSWKWSVIYHGAMIASGSVNNLEEAKRKAEANLPEDVEEKAKEDDCGCD